jgi:hypothetical protein
VEGRVSCVVGRKSVLCQSSVMTQKAWTTKNRSEAVGYSTTNTQRAKRASPVGNTKVGSLYLLSI